jgi:feruloyl esterase
MCAAAASAAGANTPSGGAPAIAPALRCADLTGLKIPGSTISISTAKAVPEAPPGTVQARPPAPAMVRVALPPNCRVDGEIDRRVGADGKPYAIGFSVALPDRWNGRLLFQGGGLLNGVVRPPIGTQAVGEVPALARGFAVVSTDSGHQGAPLDASFMRDQEASINFAHGAVGKVTLAAKAIIARYYAQAAKRTYAVGCSTGGREAMLASTRFAEEFDGVVVGAPAMRTGHSSIGLAWSNFAFSEVAPRDSAGMPEPAKLFSASDKKLIVDAIGETCDAKDGLKDGIIFNVKACQFDPASLTCNGTKTASCLSPQQAGALKKAFTAPTNSRGSPVYPAFPWDTGLAAEGVTALGILTTGARGPVGPVGRQSIDIDRMQDALAADGVGLLTDTAFWTNLNSFFARGGKALYYHGWSDPWFSAFDTVDYYERMAAASGGMEKVRAQSSRLFAVPGMGHCGTGATLDQFDLLSAVVDWVEQGKAPESVLATGPAFAGRSRPLCPYPQYAHYKGLGNPEDAASFECRP